MARLTLPQLERHLFAAAHIVRGKMDASEFKAEAAKKAAHPSFYADTFFLVAATTQGEAV